MSSRQKGFSIIEGVLAMGLISIMFTFVITVFPQARAGLQLSENHVNAAYLGRSLIDGARASGFDNLASSSGSVTFSGTDNGSPFSQTVDYAVAVSMVDTDEKQVVVTLTWREASGDKRVVLETLVVNPQGG